MRYESSWSRLFFTWYYCDGSTQRKNIGIHVTSSDERDQRENDFWIYLKYDTYYLITIFNNQWIFELDRLVITNRIDKGKKKKKRKSITEYDHSWTLKILLRTILNCFVVHIRELLTIRDSMKDRCKNVWSIFEFEFSHFFLTIQALDRNTITKCFKNDWL